MGNHSGMKMNTCLAVLALLTFLTTSCAILGPSAPKPTETALPPTSTATESATTFPTETRTLTPTETPAATPTETALPWDTKVSVQGVTFQFTSVKIYDHPVKLGDSQYSDLNPPPGESVLDVKAAIQNGDAMQIFYTRNTTNGVLNIIDDSGIAHDMEWAHGPSLSSLEMGFYVKTGTKTIIVTDVLDTTSWKVDLSPLLHPTPQPTP